MVGSSRIFISFENPSFHSDVLAIHKDNAWVSRARVDLSILEFLSSKPPVSDAIDRTDAINKGLKAGHSSQLCRSSSFPVRQQNTFHGMTQYIRLPLKPCSLLGTFLRWHDVVAQLFFGSGNNHLGGMVYFGEGSVAGDLPSVEVRDDVVWKQMHQHFIVTYHWFDSSEGLNIVVSSIIITSHAFSL
ncbi:hypothetical protein Tco_0465996 [Tanacetum coccineum]